VWPRRRGGWLPQRPGVEVMQRGAGQVAVGLGLGRAHFWDLVAASQRAGERLRFWLSLRGWLWRQLQGCAERPKPAGQRRVNGPRRPMAHPACPCASRSRACATACSWRVSTVLAAGAGAPAGPGGGQQAAQLLGLGHLGGVSWSRACRAGAGPSAALLAQQLHGFAHRVRLTPNSCASAPSLMSLPGGIWWLRMRSRSLSAMAMHRNGLAWAGHGVRAGCRLIAVRRWGQTADRPGRCSWRWDG
jgi:hypothetical protein